MSFCPSCGSKIETPANFCPNCGTSVGTKSPAPNNAISLALFKKRGFLRVVLALAGSLIFIGIVEVLSMHRAAPAYAPTPSNSTQRPITESERTFFGAAGSYLKTANSQGMLVAQTMAGASNGSSTLADIRTAILSANRIENAAYQGDYKSRTNVDVPSSVTDIATNVDETHRLFQAAMNEYLEYWSDQNTAHIISGGDTLKRCITLMNATIAQTTNKMEQLRAQ